MMGYPPPITKKEREVLSIIARGHPERKVTVPTTYGLISIPALEWSEIEIASGLDRHAFGDCIAHLVAHDYIDSFERTPGILGRLFGDKEKFFFWATEQGRRFLAQTSQDELPKEVPLPEPNAVTGEQIDDAVRIYENSFSSSPYVKEQDVRWASQVLDDDIKEEIEAAALELEQMWSTFERMFGHRGPAASEHQAAIRDPAVKRSVIRVFRAKDEQRRRKGVGPSPKPQAWDTHYESGQIDLPPPPWDN